MKENFELPVIEEQVSSASQALKNLIQEKSRVNPDRQQILEKMRPLIADARSVRISHQSIAQTIASQGIRVTKHDVIEFCRTVLGEKKPTRSKSKKRLVQRSSKSGLLKSEQTKPKVGSAQAGFRVAQDEDL